MCLRTPAARRRFAALGAVLIAALALASAGRAHGVHPRAGDEDPVVGRLAPAAPAPAGLPATPVDAATQKRFYIANDDHTDYMWSMDDAAYATWLPNMLDEYMTQAETTAAYPSDQRGRFNADGTLWVWDYEHGRTPAEVRRLWTHIHKGDITVPLNTCVQLYGAMPAEAVVRSLYYAGQLERREGMRLPLIVPMEDQTLPGGVVSLWAGSGARFAWKGICNCATQISAYDRPREIYNFTGPDGQSVLMKWNSQFNSSQSIGGYAEARDPYAAVQYMDTDPGFLSRWPWPVAAAFGYGWDDPYSYTTAFIDAARDLTDATHRVIVSNEVDFFQDFQAAYGATLPAYGASFGNEWELFDASLGAVTSSVKRSVEKLRTAEALATVVALDDSTLLDGLASARDSMNISCGLYYEHSWGPGPGVGESQRNAWQRRIAGALGGYVDLLQSRALARLAARVPLPAGVERHAVFNPLSWPRTDVVDLAAVTAWPVHVMDVSGDFEVPSQRVVVNGQTMVRILAVQVPSVGYNVYEVRPGVGMTWPASATVNGATVDNGVYAVTLGGRGQLTSVVDHKDADRQLVASGQALLDLGNGAGTVSVESTGPVSTTLRVTAGGSPAHEARVTLYKGLDRIDYDGLVTQNFGGTVGYRSTFSYTSPTTRHEEVGMIARAARLADGGDYANEDTRTDWLTLNHFVDMGEGARGVTLSATDSPYFKLGTSTPATLDATSPRITTVVGMQVDGAGFGISNQGGDSSFPSRYALRTRGAWDPAAAMRFALEDQDPLVETPVTGSAGADLPADTFSLLYIDSPDVVLWALKPAEEGIQSGVIARLWNLADTPRNATLGLNPLGIAAASTTTNIETDTGIAPVAGGALPVVLAREQMRTWRLMPDTSLGTTGGTGGALAFAVFPNPAPRGGTHLAFRLPSTAAVRLGVYDVRGARVAGRDLGTLAPGSHLVGWEAAGLRPGVYFLRLDAGAASTTRRIVVLE